MIFLKKYLNSKEMESELDNYIENEKLKYAVLITGDWGTGKTYFINKYCESKKNIIKISLYGLNNISEINDKIIKTIFNEKIKQKQKVLLENNKMISCIRRCGKIADNIAELSSSFYKKSKKIFQETLYSFVNMKNSTIIFDDFERSQININSFFGYINDLIENNKMKVILIADERKIGRTELNKNIELKYLSTIKYFQTVNKENNENKKDIDLEIEKNMNKLFSKNNVYNEIKEKIIGKVYYFRADLYEIYDALIKAYDFESDIKEIVIKNKEFVIERQEKEKFYNIRTLVFAFEVFYNLSIKTINFIKSNRNKNYYLDKLFKYCILKSIIVKKGTDVNNWEKGQDYGIVNLGYDNKYNYSDYIEGFKFVDTYIDCSVFDEKYIENVIKEYEENVINNISNPDDPLYKIQYWWKLKESELKKILKELKRLLKNNYYKLNVYSRITLYLSRIEETNFFHEDIQQIIAIMKNNIQKGIVEGTFDEDLFLETTPIVRKIYNENIGNLKVLIQNDMSLRARKKIKNILKKEKWGEMLKNYFELNYTNIDCINDFKNLLDKEMLVNNIKNKEIEEIYNFQYSLQKIYERLDKDTLKRTESELENIYKVISCIKVKDKIRLYAIEKLINYINKTIQILNSN